MADEIESMKDVDVYIQESMKRYLNNENFAGWFSEYNAVSIVYYLSGKGVQEATLAKAVLLSKEKCEQFKTITAEYSSTLYQQRSSTRELDRYEQNNYDNYVTWYGQQKADERKNELTVKKDNAVKKYNDAKKIYDDELRLIAAGAAKRFEDYTQLRGEVFAASNDDPVVLLNKVLTDLNRSYPEYSYAASSMNDQITNLYGNYNTDLKYLDSIHELVNDISDNVVRNVEKKVHVKKRQQEIHEYYHKQYDQQIFLVKILIFFAMFAIVGSILLHYNVISVNIFAGYLGFIFSIAFVVFFYYLWDFYIRDTTIFDEYEFGNYSPPSNGKVLQFKDNIIYC
jgi:hypothetical protein